MSSNASKASDTTELHERRELADAILRRISEIEARWLAAVQSDLADHDVSVTDLRDAMSDYLRELAGSLCQPESGPDTLTRGERAWVRIAREHAVTRVHLGFDIRELVHEFIVLRRELSRMIREEIPVPRDVLQADRLADMIESAIAVSVQSYADSRDYEFRRKEAEHIGFITHELRNPLTAVVMSISVLKNKIDLPPEAKTPIEIAEKNLRRLNNLIDSVLLAECLEAGKAELYPIDISLGALMAPILEAARMTAEERKLELKASFDPKLQLRLDRDLSESAIRNLVDNALKFTDKGTVSIDVVDERDAGLLVVHVRDQCGGISGEELRTIFEPFKRGHSRKPGSGLGLSIARRSVETQGGEIFAESSSNEGCHFWLALPKRIQQHERKLKAG
ncbi:MAG: HAMP domain-containing histidine kinase [Deltaproteobacteria bacterium]|nr:HAMP domain-containing histidine kinase [Deltaproteobacteria bacterium]